MTNPDPETSGAENILSRRSCRLGLGAVAFVFILAAALTWRKWPDILVDFGGQLYIPWRIMNGAVLYRDLFYFAGGPFSQYFNALLFKVCGVSFSTLIAANLILTAAAIFVIYCRFFAATDAWTATIISTGIIIVFAFAEYTSIGNYNYIAPYSHEATHGLILSIFAIALMADWIKKRKTWPAVTAGFCAGLVFLTKPDIFMALAIAVLAAFVLFYLKYGLKSLGKPLTAFIFAGIIPSLFFSFYFLRVENAHDSLRSVLFGWLPLLRGTVTKSLFYQWCLGLDAPAAHLEEIFVYFMAVVLVVALYVAAILWVKKLKGLKLQYLVVLLFLLPLLYWARTFPWIQCGWPLPLLCLSACILVAWNYRKLEQPVFPLLWSVFGLVLLAKLGVFPRIWHYGFALAMPAFVSTVYLLFWLLPVLLDKKFEIPARQFRIIVGLVLLVGFASLANGSRTIYAQKSLALGDGGDKIITSNATSEESQAIYGALLWTKKYMPPDATLAALPEGVTLNYLTRHANSTPCLDWNPTMFTVFGQTKMTDAVEQHPPDYIFIVEWDSSDFGVGYFGSSPDYGMGLMQWIQKNYKTELLIGNEPLKDKRFGIKILKHLQPSAAPLPAVN